MITSTTSLALKRCIATAVSAAMVLTMPGATAWANSDKNSLSSSGNTPLIVTGKGTPQNNFRTLPVTANSGNLGTAAGGVIALRELAGIERAINTGTNPLDVYNTAATGLHNVSSSRGSDPLVLSGLTPNANAILDGIMANTVATDGGIAAQLAKTAAGAVGAKSPIADGPLSDLKQLQDSRDSIRSLGQGGLDLILFGVRWFYRVELVDARQERDIGVEINRLTVMITALQAEKASALAVEDFRKAGEIDNTLNTKLPVSVRPRDGNTQQAGLIGYRNYLRTLLSKATQDKQAMAAQVKILTNLWTELKQFNPYPSLKLTSKFYDESGVDRLTGLMTSLQSQINPPAVSGNGEVAAIYMGVDPISGLDVLKTLPYDTNAIQTISMAGVAYFFPKLTELSVAQDKSAALARKGENAILQNGGFKNPTQVLYDQMHDTTSGTTAALDRLAQQKIAKRVVADIQGNRLQTALQSLNAGVSKMELGPIAQVERSGQFLAQVKSGQLSLSDSDSNKLIRQLLNDNRPEAAREELVNSALNQADQIQAGLFGRAASGKTPATTGAMLPGGTSLKDYFDGYYRHEQKMGPTTYVSVPGLIDEVSDAGRLAQREVSERNDLYLAMAKGGNQYAENYLIANGVDYIKTNLTGRETPRERMVDSFYRPMEVPTYKVGEDFAHVADAIAGTKDMRGAIDMLEQSARAGAQDFGRFSTGVNKGLDERYNNLNWTEQVLHDTAKGFEPMVNAISEVVRDPVQHLFEHPGATVSLVGGAAVGTLLANPVSGALGVALMNASVAAIGVGAVGQGAWNSYLETDPSQRNQAFTQGVSDGIGSGASGFLITAPIGRFIGAGAEAAGAAVKTGGGALTKAVETSRFLETSVVKTTIRGAEAVGQAGRSVMQTAASTPYLGSAVKIGEKIVTGTAYGTGVLTNAITSPGRAAFTLAAAPLIPLNLKLYGLETGLNGSISFEGVMGAVTGPSNAIWGNVAVGNPGDENYQPQRAGLITLADRVGQGIAGGPGVLSRSLVWVAETNKITTDVMSFGVGGHLAGGLAERVIGRGVGSAVFEKTAMAIPMVGFYTDQMKNLRTAMTSGNYGHFVSGVVQMAVGVKGTAGGYYREVNPLTGVRNEGGVLTRSLVSGKEFVNPFSKAGFEANTLAGRGVFRETLKLGAIAGTGVLTGMDTAVAYAAALAPIAIEPIHQTYTNDINTRNIAALNQVEYYSEGDPTIGSSEGRLQTASLHVVEGLQSGRISVDSLSDTVKRNPIIKTYLDSIQPGANTRIENESTRSVDDRQETAPRVENASEHADLKTPERTPAVTPADAAPRSDADRSIIKVFKDAGIEPSQNQVDLIKEMHAGDPSTPLETFAQDYVAGEQRRVGNQAPSEPPSVVSHRGDVIDQETARAQDARNASAGNDPYVVQLGVQASEAVRAYERVVGGPATAQEIERIALEHSANPTTTKQAARELGAKLARDSFASHEAQYRSALARATQELQKPGSTRTPEATFAAQTRLYMAVRDLARFHRAESDHAALLGDRLGAERAAARELEFAHNALLVEERAWQTGAETIKNRMQAINKKYGDLAERSDPEKGPTPEMLALRAEREALVKLAERLNARELILAKDLSEVGIQEAAKHEMTEISKTGQDNRISSQERLDRALERAKRETDYQTRVLLERLDLAKRQQQALSADDAGTRRSDKSRHDEEARVASREIKRLTLSHLDAKSKQLEGDATLDAAAKALAKAQLDLEKAIHQRDLIETDTSNDDPISRARLKALSNAERAVNDRARDVQQRAHAIELKAAEGALQGVIRSEREFNRQGQRDPFTQLKRALAANEKKLAAINTAAEERASAAAEASKERETKVSDEAARKVLAEADVAKEKTIQAADAAAKRELAAEREALSRIAQRVFAAKEPVGSKVFESKDAVTSDETFDKKVAAEKGRVLAEWKGEVSESEAANRLTNLTQTKETLDRLDKKLVAKAEDHKLAKALAYARVDHLAAEANYLKAGNGIVSRFIAGRRLAGAEKNLMKADNARAKNYIDRYLDRHQIEILGQTRVPRADAEGILKTVEESLPWFSHRDAKGNAVTKDGRTVWKDKEGHQRDAMLKLLMGESTKLGTSMGKTLLGTLFGLIDSHGQVIYMAPTAELAVKIFTDKVAGFSGEDIFNFVADKMGQEGQTRKMYNVEKLYKQWLSGDTKPLLEALRDPNAFLVMGRGTHGFMELQAQSHSDLKEAWTSNIERSLLADEVHKMSQQMSFIMGKASDVTLKATDSDWIKATVMSDLIKSHDILRLDAKEGIDGYDKAIQENKAAYYYDKNAKRAYVTPKAIDLILEKTDARGAKANTSDMAEFFRGRGQSETDGRVGAAKYEDANGQIRTVPVDEASVKQPDRSYSSSIYAAAFSTAWGLGPESVRLTDTVQQATESQALSRYKRRQGMTATPDGVRVMLSHKMGYFDTAAANSEGKFKKATVQVLAKGSDAPIRAGANKIIDNVTKWRGIRPDQVSRALMARLSGSEMNELIDSVRQRVGDRNFVEITDKMLQDVSGLEDVMRRQKPEWTAMRVTPEMLENEVLGNFIRGANYEEYLQSGTKREKIMAEYETAHQEWVERGRLGQEPISPAVRPPDVVLLTGVSGETGIDWRGNIHLGGDVTEMTTMDFDQLKGRSERGTEEQNYLTDREFWAHGVQLQEVLGRLSSTEEGALSKIWEKEGRGREEKGLEEQRPLQELLAHRDTLTPGEEQAELVRHIRQERASTESMAGDVKEKTNETMSMSAVQAVQELLGSDFATSNDLQALKDAIGEATKAKQTDASLSPDTNDIERAEQMNRELKGDLEGAVTILSKLANRLDNRAAAGEIERFVNRLQSINVKGTKADPKLVGTSVHTPEEAVAYAKKVAQDMLPFQAPLPPVVAIAQSKIYSVVNSLRGPGTGSDGASRGNSGPRIGGGEGPRSPITGGRGQEGGRGGVLAPSGRSPVQGSGTGIGPGRGTSPSDARISAQGSQTPSRGGSGVSAPQASASALMTATPEQVQQGAVSITMGKVIVDNSADVLPATIDGQSPPGPRVNTTSGEQRPAAKAGKDLTYADYYNVWTLATHAAKAGGRNAPAIVQAVAAARSVQDVQQILAQEAGQTDVPVMNSSLWQNARTFWQGNVTGSQGLIKNTRTAIRDNFKAAKEIAERGGIKNNLKANAMRVASIASGASQGLQRMLPARRDSSRAVQSILHVLSQSATINLWPTLLAYTRRDPKAVESLLTSDAIAQVALKSSKKAEGTKQALARQKQMTLDLERIRSIAQTRPTASDERGQGYRAQTVVYEGEEADRIVVTGTDIRETSRIAQFIKYAAASGRTVLIELQGPAENNRAAWIETAKAILNDRLALPSARVGIVNDQGVQYVNKNGLPAYETRKKYLENLSVPFRPWAASQAVWEKPLGERPGLTVDLDGLIQLQQQMAQFEGMSDFFKGQFDQQIDRLTEMARILMPVIRNGLIDVNPRFTAFIEVVRQGDPQKTKVALDIYLKASVEEKAQIAGTFGVPDVSSKALRFTPAMAPAQTALAHIASVLSSPAFASWGPAVLAQIRKDVAGVQKAKDPKTYLSIDQTLELARQAIQAYRAQNPVKDFKKALDKLGDKKYQVQWLNTLRGELKRVILSSVKSNDNHPLVLLVPEGASPLVLADLKAALGRRGTVIPEKSYQEYLNAQANADQKALKAAQADFAPFTQRQAFATSLQKRNAAASGVNVASTVAALAHWISMTAGNYLVGIASLPMMWTMLQMSIQKARGQEVVAGKGQHFVIATGWQFGVAVGGLTLAIVGFGLPLAVMPVVLTFGKIKAGVAAVDFIWGMQRYLAGQRPTKIIDDTSVKSVDTIEPGAANSDPTVRADIDPGYIYQPPLRTRGGISPRQAGVYFTAAVAFGGAAIGAGLVPVSLVAGLVALPLVGIGLLLYTSSRPVVSSDPVIQNDAVSAPGDLTPFPGAIFSWLSRLSPLRLLRWGTTTRQGRVAVGVGSSLLILSVLPSEGMTLASLAPAGGPAVLAWGALLITGSMILGAILKPSKGSDSLRHRARTAVSTTA